MKKTVPFLVLLFLFLSAGVTYAQEPTPTFTPPPAATPKVTATEPIPTGTYTPPPPATAPPTPDGPTSTPTPAPPTSTPTAVPTETELSIRIDLPPTVTEGDRFLVTLYLNRPTGCDTNVVLTTGRSNGLPLPDSLTVTIPQGQMGITFWLVAQDNGQTDGQRTMSVSINDAIFSCELGTVEIGNDTITVLDAPTGITPVKEPGNNRLLLPMILRSGVPFDSRGFWLGLAGIILVALIVRWRRSLRIS